MTRRTDDIATAALRRIGILDARETPSADDGALVESRFAELVGELRRKGLVVWQDDAIPVDVFGPLADMLTARIRPEFGMPYAEAEERKAERDLRVVLARPASGEPVTTEFF